MVCCWDCLRGGEALAALHQAGIAEQPMQNIGACDRRAIRSPLPMVWGSLNDECIGLLARSFKRGSFDLMAQSSLTALDFQHAILHRADTLFPAVQHNS
ncbi:hypothetical protein ASC94_10790 [Massilia sp. Root418]|nr:hypothetical protein ASC94_10790 [Massilia sp. Root418]